MGRLPSPSAPESSAPMLTAGAIFSTFLAILWVIYPAIPLPLRGQSLCIRPCITPALKHRFCQPLRQFHKRELTPSSYNKGTTIVAWRRSCVDIYYENEDVFKPIVELPTNRSCEVRSGMNFRPGCISFGMASLELFTLCLTCRWHRWW